MNIIYMHTHDSGRYWSPYGYAVHTPNIMHFAQESTLFRQAYSVAPTCSPSRAGLLTGTNPHSNGMMGLAHLGWELKDYEQHLARFLKQGGYHTLLCGIQHEAPDYQMIGYDEILGSQKFDMGDTLKSMEDFDIANTDEACRFLQSEASQKQDFFLSFGLFNTHREFPDIDGTELPDYISVPPMLPDCPEARRDMAGYHASVRVADACFGRLLEAVDQAGLRKNTMIIMTTDHGIAFPNMKCSLYDSGIGVALIIRMPDGQPQVRCTDALVSQLDIYPTICEAAKLEKPNWLEGVSLLPLIYGERTEVRNEIFAEVTYHAAYEPLRCVRTKRYKLIRRFDFHNKKVPSNIDDGLCKEFLLKNGFLEQTVTRERLYDLWLDPCEQNNLVENTNYIKIYDELSTHLENWMMHTHDPLCQMGRVGRPQGALVTRLECLSVRDGRLED